MKEIKRTLQYKQFKTNQVIDLAQMTQRGQAATHGDVIIIRCDDADMPDNFDSLPNVMGGVLAEGEHSGHAHQLFDEATNVAAYTMPQLDVIEGGKETNAAKFSLKQTEDGSMFLKVENEPMLLRHQEHNPFRIYPGNYEIGIQQETDPFERQKRAVLD